MAYNPVKKKGVCSELDDPLEPTLNLSPFTHQCFARNVFIASWSRAKGAVIQLHSIYNILENIPNTINDITGQYKPLINFTIAQYSGCTSLTMTMSYVHIPTTELHVSDFSQGVFHTR